MRALSSKFLESTVFTAFLCGKLVAAYNLLLPEKLVASPNLQLFAKLVASPYCLLRKRPSRYNFAEKSILKQAKSLDDRVLHHSALIKYM